ncbi:type II toxin-antitoxin system RatA family toxin [Roseobacter weihaiensis]|uniref:type II toxin-antitoxin system RatA family toxin n=1 Tax=Roseobacter weihaiensis TaxID=2763262 RepID=UPI001D09EBDD|nr:SRPBCC family protein [Roseobacter sp. H9]
MPIVENKVVIPEVDIAMVWDVMCDFETFPDLMADVVSVKCFDRDGPHLKSNWVVLLNGSELMWEEQDVFIHHDEIRFHQIDGDLEVWEGVWTTRQEGPDVVVNLKVEFDIGIPSLAEILNPIGERAINANTRQMLGAIKGTSKALA